MGEVVSMEREPLVKSDEVAAFLRVHVNTVYKWSHEEGLPVIKVGHRGYRRYRLSEIEKWLERRKAG